MMTVRPIVWRFAMASIAAGTSSNPATRPTTGLTLPASTRLDDLAHHLLTQLTGSEVPAHPRLQELQRFRWLVREEDAAQFEVAERDAARDDEFLVRHQLVGGKTHHQIAPVVLGAFHRLLHDGLADIVEHDVDSLVGGLAEHDLREVRRVVVDRDVRAQVPAEPYLLVGARGRKDTRSGVHRQLDRSRTRTTSGRVDEHALPGLQVSTVEQSRATPGEKGSTTPRRPAREWCRASRR